MRKIAIICSESCFKKYQQTASTKYNEGIQRDGECKQKSKQRTQEEEN